MVATTASGSGRSEGTYTDQNWPPTPPARSRARSVWNSGRSAARPSTRDPARSRNAIGRSLCPSMTGLARRARSTTDTGAAPQDSGPRARSERTMITCRSIGADRACRAQAAPRNPQVSLFGSFATGWHPDGHGPRTGRPGILLPCPADTRPATWGRYELRRTKLQKSVTALAAVVAGAGTAMVATAPASAAAPELKLAASDDAYVSSGRKGTTFGAEDKLAIGRLDGDTKISYLKFLVPAGVRVTGARLQLMTVGDVAGTVTVNR